MPIPLQTFAPEDLAKVGTLVVMEGLLSADNALVLAMLVRHLPGEQRKKALMYGLIGALAFRGIAVIFAGLILKLWFLQGLGAAYLLWLPIKHFFLTDHGDGETGSKHAGASFWSTVLWVELTDLAFAVDSILAGIAVADGPDKLWMVWAGGFIGVVLLRIAAGALVGLLEKFPAMNHVAYLLVAWVGVKMATLTAHTFGKAHPELAWARGLEEMPPPVFWGGMAAIFVFGTVWAYRSRVSAPRAE